MALPSSGTITLQDIQAEFGGPTNPIALKNYYRGGAYVQDTAANSGVPTSGSIGLIDFYGAVNAVYQAIGVNATNTDGGGGSRLISYTLRYDSDGLVRHTREIGGSASTTSIGNWSSLYPSETGTGWSVRLRFLSGTNIYASGDALNTWHPLTSDRSWTLSNTVSEFGSVSGAFLICISTDGGTTTFDSTSFTVTLTNEGP